MAIDRSGTRCVDAREVRSQRKSEKIRYGYHSLQKGKLFELDRLWALKIRTVASAATLAGKHRSNSAVGVHILRKGSTRRMRKGSTIRVAKRLNISISEAIFWYNVSINKEGAIPMSKLHTYTERVKGLDKKAELSMNVPENS